MKTSAAGLRWLSRFEGNLENIESLERGVSEMVRVPLTQNQFDALMTFTYSVGILHVETSRLLRKLNLGDYRGAADEFRRWVWGIDRKTWNRSILRGLVLRREAEAELFLTPD